MSQSTQKSNTVQMPGKLGARLSMWQNASKKKPIQRKLTKVPKKMTKTWKPTNESKEPPKQKQHRSSSIDAQTLKYFSHSGEKYFKILIDSLILYKDKLFQVSSKQTDLLKDDIVPGTYITNKIVLFGEPYNLYCDSKYVEPVDINHSLYLQYQKQKQNKQFIDRVNIIGQQLEQITAAQKLQNNSYEEEDEKGNIETETNEEMMTCAAELVIPPTLPQQPKKNARAFFSDDFISPNHAIPYDTTNIYSDYVGEGSYAENRNAFPNASRGTFDAIAIDANTRVILYEKTNFEGDVLLDATGPMLINNVQHKGYYPQVITDTFQDVEIQNNYPSSVRVWSETNMNLWTTGSVKIVASNKYT